MCVLVRTKICGECVNRNTRVVVDVMRNQVRDTFSNKDTVIKILVSSIMVSYKKRSVERGVIP